MGSLELITAPVQVPQFIIYRENSHHRAHRPDTPSIHRRMLISQQRQKELAVDSNGNDISGTTDALSSYGFVTEHERNQLFLTYGKKNVKSTVMELVRNGENPTREELVATLDSRVRQGWQYTIRLLARRGEILAEAKKYYTQNPLPMHNGGNPVHQLKQNAHCYLVQRYLLDMNVELPQPVNIFV